MLHPGKFGRRYVQGMILTLLPALLMTGCVVIPIPTGEKPYYDAALTNLEAGVTSKDAVLAELGVPDVTYNQGSELVYIETQESWKVAWAFLPVVPWCTGNCLYGGVETLHKRFVLALYFDTEGALSTFELDTAGDDFGDCTSHGICLGKTNAVMQYADMVTDATAKEFRFSENQCSIYLHGPGNKKAYEVSLNGKIPVNMFSTGAFVHWQTKPGRHSLVVFPEPVFLDFDCKAGEIKFVHFDLIRPRPSSLRLEDSATGRRHIASRRLILLPTGSHG